MKTITINTDASFSKKYCIGTFAFWIVCDEGKIAKSGILRKKVKRPEQAEFKCIINALHVLVSSSFSKPEKVIVNTDCLNVIHLMKRNKEQIQRYGLASWGTRLVSALELLMIKSGWGKVTIDFRHVPSHQGTETSRKWVNDWCDTEAKTRLHQALNKIRKEEVRHA